MICFSAIVPHSPLLVPRIGKENTELLERTRSAIHQLSEELYASRPDTIVVISAHETQHASAFSVNLHDSYRVSLEAFGDLDTSTQFSGDVVLMNEIVDAAQEREIPFTLDSYHELNYGTGVALELLASNLSQAKIIPVSISGLGFKEHVQFGTMLKDVLEHTHKRVAIIASGDLSHCVNEQAPLGKRPEGAEYDSLIQEAVASVSTSVLLSTSDNLLEKAQGSIHKQLLILFGVLEHTNVRTELLSYEAPFGVGYLVAQFHYPAV
jgi:AmmeMemoRadiSam system protein B